MIRALLALTLLALAPCAAPPAATMRAEAPQATNAPTTSLAAIDVTPLGPAEFTTYQGSATCQTEAYVLHNRTAVKMLWTVTVAATWLEAYPTHGSLGPGATVTVRLRPNLSAGALPVGVYDVPAGVIFNWQEAPTATTQPGVPKAKASDSA